MKVTIMKRCIFILLSIFFIVQCNSDNKTHSSERSNSSIAPDTLSGITVRGSIVVGGEIIGGRERDFSFNSEDTVTFLYAYSNSSFVPAYANYSYQKVGRNTAKIKISGGYLAQYKESYEFDFTFSSNNVVTGKGYAYDDKKRYNAILNGKIVER